MMVVFGSDHQGVTALQRRHRLSRSLPMLRNFLHDEDGATSIEYALIAGIVSVAIIAGASTLGEILQEMYSSYATEVANANTL